jgi:hypothetical protein
VPIEQVEQTGVAVARVVALYRYPVKSMRGERIEATAVSWHGVAGDRRYAFVRGDDASGFPWLTARQVPQMVRYTPRFVDPARPRESAVVVRLTDGRELPVTSAALLEDLAGRYRAPGPIHLLQISRGAHDSAGISIISTTTLNTLSDRVGEELDPVRFRPNIVVELLPGAKGTEDEWADGLACFGERADSARVRANRKDVRCMMVNLDPETAQQNPAVLRAVVQMRAECAGIYGAVEAPGTIQVGDIVWLTRVTSGE